jgi:hypothetical protein
MEQPSWPRPRFGCRFESKIWNPFYSVSSQGFRRDKYGAGDCLNGNRGMYRGLRASE